MWRLLATFARRKMARSIERQSAVKRGGNQVRRSLDSIQHGVASNRDLDSEEGADAFLAMLKAELPENLFVIVEGILAGQTHRELAPITSNRLSEPFVAGSRVFASDWPRTPAKRGRHHKRGE